MKRLALILTGALAVLLGACAPSTDITMRVPVQVLAVTVPQTMGDTVVVQGRNLGDGRTGGERANYVLFARTPDARDGQRVQVLSWTPNRIEFVSPDEAGTGWLIVVANGVRGEAFPISLP
ncbi:MAG: hypothetical protein GX560_09855 [Deinococcales bacterium]|nr:hypothetical protein [Deinococcales bacterium]